MSEETEPSPQETSNLIVHSSEPRNPALPAPNEGLELPEPDLSEAQRAALAMMVQGRRFGEIAAALKIDRITLYRWRTGNPDFIAALNRMRGEMLAETRERVLAIGAKAVDALDKVITGGEGRLGFRLLDKLGSLRPGPEHPVDPFAIFGVGIEDEMGRGRILDGLKILADGMTDEQKGRSLQLMAMAIVIDNERENRPSKSEVLELAGRNVEGWEARATRIETLIPPPRSDALITLRHTPIDAPMPARKSVAAGVQVKVRVARQWHGHPVHAV